MQFFVKTPFPVVLGFKAVDLPTCPPACSSGSPAVAAPAREDSISKILALEIRGPHYRSDLIWRTEHSE